MKTRLAARTIPGRGKAPNEDAILVRPLTNGSAALPEDSLAAGCEVVGPVLATVADGMGGSAGGHVASHAALAALHERAAEGPPEADPRAAQAWLLSAAAAANRRVFALGRDDLALDGMGTTLTAALFARGHLLLAHVGDTRAYHLRAGRLRQLTIDDSLVQELVAAGDLTAERARTDPRRNTLTRALGPEDPVQIDGFLTPLEPGDRLLLCSDGVHGSLDDEVLRDLLAEPRPASELCARLVRAALAKGSRDNISAIVIDLLEPEAGG